MSEKDASSLAAELSLDEDLPPFLRLKNDLLVAVQVLRVDPEKKQEKIKVSLSCNCIFNVAKSFPF